MESGLIEIGVAAAAVAPVAPSVALQATDGRLRDKLGRAITDLRVSVTDRCNYRCVYCRTGEEGVQFTELPMEAYLRMIRVFVSMGVEKVRLTGGEPLLRRGLLELVQQLGAMRTSWLPDGRPVELGEGRQLDLALTTNGHLLEGMAGPLKQAGLSRVTVSMDAVEPAIFEAVTRVPRSFDRVLAGVREAQRVGLGPVKVNCVLLRGINDGQIEAFAEFSRREGVVVRFIEWMPLEEGRTWTEASVVPMSEILDRLGRVRPLVELPASQRSETARRFTFDDGVGEIGVIAPVSRPFCGECSRARLTSDGRIRTCLFSQSEHDLYGLMQRGGSDEQMRDYIQRVIARKEARHHIGESEFLQPSRSMVHIGG